MGRLVVAAAPEATIAAMEAAPAPAPPTAISTVLQAAMTLRHAGGREPPILLAPTRPRPTPAWLALAHCPNSLSPAPTAPAPAVIVANPRPIGGPKVSRTHGTQMVEAAASMSNQMRRYCPGR